MLVPYYQDTWHHVPDTCTLVLTMVRNLNLIYVNNICKQQF